MNIKLFRGDIKSRRFSLNQLNSILAEDRPGVIRYQGWGASVISILILGHSAVAIIA